MASTWKETKERKRVKSIVGTYTTMIVSLSYNFIHKMLWKTLVILGT